MEYEPDERKPLMRTISEDGVFDPPQTPVFYDISRRKRRVACFSILLTELLERLAFYGITANFVLFLNQDPFQWVSYRAVHVFFGFTAISYIFSVVGGLVADTLLGRFKTICISLVMYVFGIVFFVLLGYASMPEHTDFCEKLCGVSSTEHSKTVLCLWPLLLATCLTAIAGGSIRANMSPFGAEQLKHEGPDMIRTFFNWFYWAINIGSLLALGVIAYVQQNWSFFYGYIGVAMSLVLALLVFVGGRFTYLTRKPTGSVLPNTFKIIGEAFRRRGQRKDTNRRRVSSHMLTSCPKVTFLDMAKKRYGGSFPDTMVEDVKSLKKVIGVFLLLVPYWMVYYQMQSTFAVQGLHMKFTVQTSGVASGPSAFQFPVAWLSLFDVVVVILLLPVLDRCIYPCLIRRGYNISLFVRIVLGMVFSTLSVCAAGGLEFYRRECWHNTPNCTLNQTINNNTTYEAANIWIFWQIPQYVLIGLSEVFASVAALEFAYSHAPKSMQGLIMGLFCLSNGVGSLCGSALMALLTLAPFSWFNERDAGNINWGRLDYYFFVLAGIQLAATVLFCCLKVRSVMNRRDGSDLSRGSRFSSRHIQVQRKTSTSSSGE